MKPENFCRICGLIYENFYPWGKFNDTPTFEYCDCCNAEFGYQDCQLIAIKRYRKHWINNGATWFDKSKKPDNWSLENQLKNLPKKYL